MAKGVTFTRESAERIAEAVQAVERGAPENLGAPRFGGKFSRKIWIKLTSSDELGANFLRYVYAWTQQIQTAKGWADYPNGLTGETDENFALNTAEVAHSNMPVTAGTVVEGTIGKCWISDHWEMRVSFQHKMPHLFPVVVYVDAGDQGGKETEPDFVYEVWDETDSFQLVRTKGGNLADNMTPQANQRTIGKVLPGTYGLAYYLADAPGTASPDANDLPTSPDGLVTPGNIDLNGRPIVMNEDGTISTVRSITVDITGGNSVLLPTVKPDGSGIWTNDEAIANYASTGDHLGIFSSSAAADAFGELIHQQQLSRYGDVLVLFWVNETPTKSVTVCPDPPA